MSYYETEIIELHQFFEDWFNGKLPNTDATFDRFSSVMGAEFVIISPAGTLTDRDGIVTALRRSHAARQGVKIWIQDVVVHQSLDDLTIVTYEEWQQESDQSPRGRLSTVVFQQAADTPNGLSWCHVHETWLPT